MKHKVSKIQHKTWEYFVCGEHARVYTRLEEVERDHPDGFEITTKVMID